MKNIIFGAIGVLILVVILIIFNFYQKNKNKNTISIKSSAVVISGDDNSTSQESEPPISMPDASMPDASMPDASMPDASMPDASMPDADSSEYVIVLPSIPDIPDNFDETMKLFYKSEGVPMVNGYNNYSNKMVSADFYNVLRSMGENIYQWQKGSADNCKAVCDDSFFCIGYNIDNTSDVEKCQIIIGSGGMDIMNSSLDKNGYDLHIKDYGISKENTQNDINHLYYRLNKFKIDGDITLITPDTTLHKCALSCSSNPYCAYFNFNQETKDCEIYYEPPSAGEEFGEELATDVYYKKSLYNASDLGL